MKWLRAIRRTVLAAAACAVAGISTSQALAQDGPGEPLSAELVSAILASTEDYWRVLIAANAGRSDALNGYVEPKLRLFLEDTETRCGHSRRFRGLFYCGAENRIYFREGTVVGLSSFDDGSADFAIAFIVAHEVAHAIQSALYGTGAAGLARRSDAGLGSLSRAFELQADCLAGVWASYVGERGYLEAGDVAEAVALAEKVGDRGGTVRHGTASERAEHFEAGMRGGHPAACDLFPELVDAAGGASLTQAFAVEPLLVPLLGAR